MPVGGIRRRLIKHSFEMMLRNSLDQLDWFEPNRNHDPVTIISIPMDEYGPEEIKPNVISIAPEGERSEYWEMGSLMEEVRWDFYIDIFAENHAIGIHLTGDVEDIIKGKMPSIGRNRPHLEVLDYQQATPTPLFVCQIENVIVERVRDWTHPLQKHWYALGFEMVDYYTDENDEVQDYG